ncbi:DUF501 domain-containing protein [Bifidobacterium sp. W8101]|nr:DUF501 domain-containing protein [Bifidobacterium choladohabitans]MBI0128429.1 DUF501 domain-containing protein [Bifidobacterium sp. W8103]MBI0139198.1 DUF501 domain-containing protein [Bifidobacterium sp. W8105]MBI0149562.1 DUF501 domain-containing protein [Bifidobacterium sp. W8107]
MIKAQGRPQAAVEPQAGDKARVEPQVGQDKVEISGLVADRDLAAVRERVQELLATPATPEQIAVVNRQLGRYPRGMVAVGARCVCGNPLAVVTRPQLEDGTPFPTTCYLTSPEAVKAVSRLEADGIMADWNTELGSDANLASAYRRAHELYLAFRSVLAQRLGDDEGHITGISAGGMPKRVKCLHALTAQSLVMGPGINPLGDRVLGLVRQVFDPQVCRCAQPRTEASRQEDRQEKQ